MIENRIISRLHSWLINSYPKNEGVKWTLWNKVYRLAERRYKTSTVSANVHGRKTYMNFGHPYPIFSRKFKQWNNPLIELINQTYCNISTLVNVVDIGAGIGDTVRLVQANLPNMVGHFYCIDGDKEFFDYLSTNCPASPQVSLYNVMLSSTAGDIPSLIRHHSGSSTAQGNDKIKSTTLDNLLKNKVGKIHVIKIDVDGYDGQVIAGMQTILKQDKPEIIFEWHPILCAQAGNSWLEHFEILSNCGYTRFVWFSKYGHFSHFMTGLDIDAINKLARICTNGKHDTDWHYDIIALQMNSTLSDESLAELKNAKHRRSHY